MHDTDWINGSYSDAMQMVVERALFSQERGGLVKQGDVLESILGNPHMQRAFAGAAIGGGLGGAMPGKNDYGEQNSRIGQGLKGALLGGAVGGGSGILKNYLEANPPDLHGLLAKAKALFGNTMTGVQELSGNIGNSIKSADMAGAIGQSQDARRELGILGADETKIDPLMGQLRAGKLSPGAAASGAAKQVPGVVSQFTHIPGAVGTAVRQGDFDNAAAQLDAPGLKNLNPFSQHFSPTTAMAAGGMGMLGGHLKNMKDLNQVATGFYPEGPTAPMPGHVPAAPLTAKNMFGPGNRSSLMHRAKEIFMGPQGTAATGESMAHSAARELSHANAKLKPGRFGKLAPVVGMASLPLLAREWFGGHGYRSGHKPIQDLVSANQELAGK